MKIEILGMGCPKCKQLFDNTKKAVDELGINAELIKVEDMVKITEYGVMTTPAVVVDGKVKVAGNVPSSDEIKGMLV